jgi:hypothetical protein
MAVVTGTRKEVKFGFLHLGVSFAATDGAAERVAIEQVLDKARDWFRYAPNCWLIYTSRSAKSWQDDILKLPGMKSHTLFICEVNIQNRSGWLYPSTWEWIDKSR